MDTSVLFSDLLKIVKDPKTMPYVKSLTLILEQDFTHKEKNKTCIAYNIDVDRNESSLLFDDGTVSHLYAFSQLGKEVVINSLSDSLETLLFSPVTELSTVSDDPFLTGRLKQLRVR